MSYLIPTEELALSRQEALRQKAKIAGKNRALAKKIVTDVGNAYERDADYVTDFIPAATSAGLAGWLSMPFVAVGALYSIFADNVPAAVVPVVPNNNIWVFYKVSVLTVAGPDPTSMLFFRVGTGANLKAQFDLEALYGKSVLDGYFSQPVVYDDQDVVTVTAEARVAIAVGCRIRLGCFIIEPSQVTLV